VWSNAQKRSWANEKIIAIVDLGNVMQIPTHYYDQIREIDVNCHSVDCKFKVWRKTFSENGDVLTKIDTIDSTLGANFNRSNLVGFYAREDCDIATKFLATMIWGNEAPLDSKRDNRGPSRVFAMFESLKEAPNLLSSLSIKSIPEIKQAYNAHRKIKKCGPNFFTKHLYFLGKSAGAKCRDGTSYPLIFDNRVAVGLSRLSITDKLLPNLVSIQAITRSDAYLKYLAFVYEQSSKIQCEPDQIEYFLFSDFAVG